MNSLGAEYTKERIKARIEEKITNPEKEKIAFPYKKKRKPNPDYSRKTLIDTNDEKYKDSPGLQHWADIQNLKIAAISYSQSESLAVLQEQIKNKSKNPDHYFRTHESQLILFDGAVNMLERYKIDYKHLNLDKIQKDFELLSQKKAELQATYKSAEKDISTLQKQINNVNQYLGKDISKEHDVDKKRDKEEI